MYAVFIRPEWWNWAIFIIVPLLLILFAFAISAIISGFAGLFRSTSSNGRPIPDMMAFLKERYSRKRRAFQYEESRRPLIRR